MKQFSVNYLTWYVIAVVSFTLSWPSFISWSFIPIRITVTPLVMLANQASYRSAITKDIPKRKVQLWRHLLWIFSRSAEIIPRFCIGPNNLAGNRWRKSIFKLTQHSLDRSTDNSHIPEAMYGFDAVYDFLLLVFNRDNPVKNSTPACHLHIICCV